VTCEDIRTANRLLYGPASLTFALCIIGMGVASWIM